MRLSRERVWEIVEVARPGDKASRRFDMFILALIGLNVVAVMLQSVEAIQNRFAWPFFLFELVSVIVFSIEYLARLWASVEDPRFSRPVLVRMRFAVRPLVLIDFLAIAPFLVSFATVDLRIMRAARLFRLVRLVKATRYVRAARHFRTVLQSKREELILTTGLMSMMLILASSVMYFAENAAQPDKFASIPESMWWAIATLTTVGYGDVFPITVMGKLAAGVIAILGIGFFALPTAILGSGFVEAIAADKQQRACPHCGKLLE
jgi:voltage-gated potassium channel